MKMKTLYKTLLLTLVVVLSNSCISSLKVDVDVFDLYALKKASYYNFLKPESLESFLLHNRTQEIYLDSTQNMINKLESYVLMNYDINTANLSKFGDTIKTKACKYLDTYDYRIFRAYAVLVKSDSTVNIFEAYHMYKTAENQLHQNFDTLTQHIKKIFPILDIHSINSIIINPILPTLHEQELAFSFGISITNDPLASLVVNAPEKYWKKYDTNDSITRLNAESARRKKKSRINHTLVKTKFGNADVAIKMDSPGSFIVKGARVDADEALKASFKVLNQGIKYLAYSSGIPTPQNTSENNKTNSPQIPEIAENNRLHNDLKTLTSQSDLVTQAFLKSLIFELRKMDNGDTTSVVRMKRSFSAYNKLLITEKSK